MKLFAVAILSALLFVLSVQIYSFLGREKQAEEEFSEFKTKLENAKLDQSKFQAELDFYMNPANLEKELRARFNYKEPDEKMLIIVPRSSTSTATTSPQ